MAWFDVTINSKGITYDIQNSWHSSIQRQRGFAPLTHITAIESAEVRVLSLRYALAFGAVICGFAVYFDERLFNDQILTSLIIVGGLLAAWYFWVEEQVIVSVAGLGFIRITTRNQNAQTLIEELQKQLEAAQQKPS